MRRAFRLGLLLMALCGRARAESEIPESELMAPPTPARLTQILSAGKQEGWARQVAALRAAARSAYAKDKLLAAAGWFRVYRWAELWGKTEQEFIPQWIGAVQSARVAHANMSRQFTGTTRPLGRELSPELQAWLLGNPEFSEEFFRLLEPVDYVPRVFEILNQLHAADPARFKLYANLALAIAVVHDVPPPPDWPHAQISVNPAPRKWPDALDAFEWWIQEDKRGRTFHRLARLGAGELKFVVDAAAPFDELEWSQKVANYPLNQLAKAYQMVRYRPERAANQRPMWEGKDYSMPAILGEGGICVDQAYFATQTGKARGVPTLMFVGAGNDGRHAWFGFLDESQKWQLDAGRYDDQQFVVGYARDPQTWSTISDHELLFLAERFHALPSFRQSRAHSDFALDFLATGDFALAAKAARKAVNYERRNQAGWEALLAAERWLGREVKQREATLQEAIRAFQSYPDLTVVYSKRLIESLRERGETSAADFEERKLARKYQGARRDISVQGAREMLDRSIATQPLLEQVRSYNRIVDSFGRESGIGFVDEVVRVFVLHLLKLDQPAEATRALEKARHALEIQPGSQLDQEFGRLEKTIKAWRP